MPAGRPRAALCHAREALTLFGAGGHRPGEARALNAIGWCHARLEEHAEALACCQRSLDLFREEGDRHSEATTLLRLGDTWRAMGMPGAAEAAWLRALAIFEELGSPEAGTAKARLRAGEVDAGRSRPAWCP